MVSSTSYIIVVSYVRFLSSLLKLGKVTDNNIILCKVRYLLAIRPPQLDFDDYQSS